MTILHRPLRLVGGHFCHFSKWSQFSNISFILAVFCIEQLQCLVETFLGEAKAIGFGFVKRDRFGVDDLLILFMDCDSLNFQTRLT